MHPGITSGMADGRFDTLTGEHDRAVREFIAKARAIDSERWVTPRAEGKWTPAQEVRHIILCYAEFLRQLNGGTPIRLRGGLYTRVVSRAIGLTSILWFKRIPVAVRAPREIRPEPENTPAAELLAELQRELSAFAATFERAWLETPRPRMQHPLFGRVSLDTGIRFLTVHTRHHAAFLPSTTRTS